MSEKAERERQRILDEIRPQLAAVAGRIESSAPDEARQIVYDIVDETVGFLRGSADAGGDIGCHPA